MALETRLRDTLLRLRRPDGGFSTSATGSSELEPTAVATLALGGDPPGRRWLEGRQRQDGSFRERDRPPHGPTSAALAALALRGEPARRALRYAVDRRSLPLPDARDPDLRGWGWTADTRSFVEPTSRVLIAVKRLTPRNGSVRSDATRLLEEWQCVDGGWNHGVASVLEAELPGYAQTTAIALVALQGERRPFVRDAMRFLRRQWRREPGGLTVAQALIAFRLHGVRDEIGPARDALARLAEHPSLNERPLVLAWATLAIGADARLDALRVTA